MIVRISEAAIQRIDAMNRAAQIERGKLKISPMLASKIARDVAKSKRCTLCNYRQKSKPINNEKASKNTNQPRHSLRTSSDAVSRPQYSWINDGTPRR